VKAEKHDTPDFGISSIGVEDAVNALQWLVRRRLTNQCFESASTDDALALRRFAENPSSILK
jgi:hypothetical protein